MTKQVSPFTKEELIPQEEKLEIYKNKGLIVMTTLMVQIYLYVCNNVYIIKNYLFKVSYVRY